jgi:hypothetical protein
MKLNWLGAAILLAGIVAFFVFKIWEGAVISRLAPLFPSYSEHPPGYYIDMIRLIATEALWITIFFGAFLFAASSAWFERTFTKIDHVITTHANRTMTLILIAFAVITTMVAVYGLRTFANSADEYAYLFQANDLAMGRYWSDVHPMPDFFDFHHIVQRDGKWMGRFPPGWPIMLAPAYVLGIPPFLINVILGVLALWLFYKLVRKIYDARIAIWSMLAVAATGYYIFNSASYFSHTSSFLHVVCAMYFTFRYYDKRQVGFALLAGIFVGLLALTRPYTAIIIFAPFYLYIVATYKWNSVKPILFITAGAMPIMVFLFWYNYRTTGSPIIPVTVWAYDEEALGFVKGHTPMKGLKHIFKRFAMFIYWVSPHFLILYGIFLFARIRDIRNILRHPEDYYFLLLVLGYFFYYEYGGNQYGPRFYFEGFPFLVVFVAVKVLRNNITWGRALFITGVMFALVKIPFITAREHQVVDERMDVYDKVAEAGLTNAIVFVNSSTGVIRPMYKANLNRNDKAYQNDVLYALDLGKKNRQLMRYYSDRKFYLYTRDEDEVDGVLTEFTTDSLLVSGETHEQESMEPEKE